MFDEVLWSDVAGAYVAGGVVVFFVMLGVIFYEGKLRSNGEGSQMIAALLVSAFVAAVWPLAMSILVVSLPFYVRDKWRK